MRGPRYTPEEKAFIKQLFLEHKGDFEKISREYHKQFPRCKRKPVALRKQHDAIMEDEKRPSASRCDFFGWRRNKGNLDVVVKRLARAIVGTDAAMAKASVSCLKARGLRKENARLRQELKDTRRANNLLAAQLRRLQRFAGIMQDTFRRAEKAKVVGGD